MIRQRAEAGADVPVKVLRRQEYILIDGKIVKTSTGDLAKEIEENGYAQYRK